MEHFYRESSHTTEDEGQPPPQKRQQPGTPALTEDQTETPSGSSGYQARKEHYFPGERAPAQARPSSTATAKPQQARTQGHTPGVHAPAQARSPPATKDRRTQAPSGQTFIPPRHPDLITPKIRVQPPARKVYLQPHHRTETPILDYSEYHSEHDYHSGNTIRTGTGSHSTGDEEPPLRGGTQSYKGNLVWTPSTPAMKPAPKDFEPDKRAEQHRHTEELVARAVTGLPPTEPITETVRVGHRFRPFQDGGGRISPGRYRPERRPPRTLTHLINTMKPVVEEHRLVDKMGVSVL